MTTVQIIETARQMLPFTSEFDHDVIRIPVSNKHRLEIETNLPTFENPAECYKGFYEVEFRKQYIRNIAIGWEFINIYQMP